MSMSSITVRNIPEGVKAALVKKARRSGESLEAFLRRLLEREAENRFERDELRRKFDAILERIDNLPPLKPGEKDAWELTEEFSKNDSPALP